MLDNSGQHLSCNRESSTLFVNADSAADPQSQDSEMLKHGGQSHILDDTNPLPQSLPRGREVKRSSSRFTLHPSPKKQVAFTLAEVLITLGIIGVVAAMTIPVIIHKYQIKVLEAQFKKAYAVVQNVNLMMKANDINPYEDYQINTLQRDEAVIIKEIEDFAKYTQGSYICEDYYYTCVFGKNIPKSKRYKNLDASDDAHIDADAYTKKTIMLPDGAVVWVGDSQWAKARYYYDINGTAKGPNKLGYDLHAFLIQENGTISANKNNGNVNRCSFKDTAQNARYLGFNCTYYAITNTNPDKEGGKYWGDFIK